VSPEVWTAVGSIVSATVIAATAAAALIQLRHLRAGNAINAMLTLRSAFSDVDFRRAQEALRGDALAEAMRDPRFRAFVARKSPAPSDAAGDLYRSFILVANWYEVLGSMVMQKVVTMRAVGDNYANVVDYNWRVCEPAIAYMRAALGDSSPFEAFEYLTVISRKWMDDFPSAYPPGVQRLNAPNPYPIEEEDYARLPSGVAANDR